MRKISICSITELKDILTVFYGFSFNDIGIIGIRDRLFDKYETLKIIDKDEIERLRNQNQNNKFLYLYDYIIECMDLEALPCQFVLYTG